jgi:hypothetical protein
MGRQRRFLRPRDLIQFAECCVDSALSIFGGTSVRCVNSAEQRAEGQIVISYCVIKQNAISI